MNEHRNIIGKIRIMSRKEFVYDANYPNIELGHFDPDKSKTFDSYDLQSISQKKPVDERTLRNIIQKLILYFVVTFLLSSIIFVIIYFIDIIMK